MSLATAAHARPNYRRSVLRALRTHEFGSQSIGRARELTSPRAELLELLVELVDLAVVRVQ